MAIIIRVSELLGKHKMTQKELSIRTGIRPATISSLYHETVKRIEISHIDKLCTAFNCTPEDLFKYVKDKE